MYLARDRINKKLRAIKMTKLTKKLTNSNYADFIKNEVNVLRVMKSKNINRLIEVFEDSQQVSIVLDYIKGDNLYDIIKKGQKLKHDEVFHIAQTLLQVVEEMNYYGYVHRDIKPSNIIIKRHSNTKEKIPLNCWLIDFNLAVGYLTQGNLAKLVAGTTGYLAPEICYKDRTPAHGRGFDYRKLDSFAIGIIIWE